MKFLFDFGISQEDPLSEQLVLDIRASDRILSLASGGEVPLSFLSMNENVNVTAVDISERQVMLCRLKLAAAVHLEFPLNGCFLGYAKFEEIQRCELYKEKIRCHLSENDALFWDQNMAFIRKGIINAGRFEQYIRKLRVLVNLVIGKRNINRLIACRSLDEQKKVFADYIASRRSLQLIFKIAFHPVIYKKRGLQEQALIHAEKNTGERFYKKFRDFCTSALAAENYFLQYFLTGSCITNKAFPAFLQPVNKRRLINNMQNFELVCTSMQNALTEKEKGYFNKIHLSNLGDWLSKEDFSHMLALLRLTCRNGTRICYRYLQKNHIPENGTTNFLIDNELSALAQDRDRFPFYGILAIIMKNTGNQAER